MVTTKHLTEEHKRKIGEANSKKTRSPELRRRISMTLKMKGIKPTQVYHEIEESHHKWKGGIKTYRKMLERRKFDLSKCSKCEGTKQVCVHHIDGDRYNNSLDNLEILCSKCHNELHGIGVGTRFKKGHEVPQAWIEKSNKTKQEINLWHIQV